jgi:hypothetical protein
MKIKLQNTSPSKAGFLEPKKLRRRSRRSDYKTSPELVPWVIITMVLVKLAMILFGGNK